MQGVSLVPLLDDPRASVRDQVLVEEDEIFDLAMVGRPLRMRTLITEDARLTRYQGSTHGELFDLGNDPSEMENLFAKPAGRELRYEMSERLAELLLEYAYESPRPTAPS